MFAHKSSFIEKPQNKSGPKKLGEKGICRPIKKIAFVKIFWTFSFRFFFFGCEAKTCVWVPKVKRNYPFFHVFNFVLQSERKVFIRHYLWEKRITIWCFCFLWLMLLCFSGFVNFGLNSCIEVWSWTWYKWFKFWSTVDWCLTFPTYFGFIYGCLFLQQWISSSASTAGS